MQHRSDCFAEAESCNSTPNAPTGATSDYVCDATNQRASACVSGEVEPVIWVEIPTGV